MSRPRIAFATLCLGLTCLHAGCSSNRRNGPPPAPKEPELHEIVLNAAPPEELGAELLSGARHTHRELLEELENIRVQPMIKGLYLRIGSLSGSWGRVTELRRALARIREAKKPVHCHFDNTDNVGYSLLASSCDRISMGPTGMLALTGVRAETIYAKDLLAMVGLEAELLQVGRFKGAADTLTRSTMPNEVREVLDRLVDDLQSALASAVLNGRNLNEAALRAALDSGPHAVNSALEHKLIDALAFDDEARAHAKTAAHAERVVRALGDDDSERLDLGDVLSALFSGKQEKPQGERICLAYLSGAISDDTRDRGNGASSGPFVSAMRRIADDREIRALVLRIDSPGGSALASDKMWHAVRRVAKRKPVIVSVGDMAASGGYYVAAAGSEIFAEDESIVGSIGVVGGKIVGENLAARLGVRPIALTRGRNAGWTSPFHPFSDSERDAVSRAIRHTYDTFIARVRDGRNLDAERLSAVAEGRIMSGKRAHSGGLVDTLGGLSDALARARNKGGLKPDSDVEVWPKERSVLERASRVLGGADAQTPALEGLVQALPELARSPIVSAWLHGEMSPLATLPFVLRIE